MEKAHELKPQESQKLERVDVPIRVLRLDGETESRTRINAEVTEEYVELILEGIELPPVRVCWDGTSYWLTDGFHRVAAAQRLGHKTISAEVFHGTLSDAQWDSYRANAVHGLRRTPADVKLVIARALRHENSAKLTNCELARHLHVSEKTIRRFRSQLPSAQAEDERIARRKGQEYKINTANIGKAGKRPPTQPTPAADAAATLERRLAADLITMDHEASPDVRRILKVFGQWVERAPDPSIVLGALTDLVKEFKGNSAATRPSRM
jgi:uncharacterized ParB-like nuclease family protein